MANAVPSSRRTKIFAPPRIYRGLARSGNVTGTLTEGNLSSERQNKPLELRALLMPYHFAKTELLTVQGVETEKNDDDELKDMHQN